MKRQVLICSECGQAIREDDVYFDVLGEQFCIKCIQPHFKVAVKINDAD